MVGIGTALAGYGQAQPQIQQIQQMQQKRQQDAAVSKALQQYAQRPGAAGGMPPLDKMMDMMLQSGLPPEQQFEALKSYGAFATPYEKMLQQMEMKQMQLENTSKMTEERLGMMKTIALMNNGTRKDIASGHDETTQRGQDIRADTAEGVQDIQQQRADTYQQRTNAQDIQGEENLRVKQQNADTAADRAGTYKSSTMAKDKREGEKLDFRKMALKEKNDLVIRGQDKQYQARLAAIAGKGTSKNQAEFKAAQTAFVQASANYRNAKMSLNTDKAELDAMATKAAEAQQKMENAAAKSQSADRPPAAPVNITRDDITPENLEHTAKVNNITVDEVKKRLGVQ